MTVLLDMNVVLDVLLQRDPYFDRSEAVWKACDEGRLNPYLAAIAPPTNFYIARKLKGIDEARKAVELCLSAFGIAPVDRRILTSAMEISGSDFEDNVQIACAQSLPAAAIVTRDRTGFKQSPVPVLEPDELLAKLAS